MSHYQEPVRDFLHAKRSVFVSPECKIQLHSGLQSKGSYWYCDIIALDLEAKNVYLCEVTYSKTLAALLKRLNSWEVNWNQIKSALIRDCCVDPSWTVIPWVFFPQANYELFIKKHNSSKSAAPPSSPPPSPARSTSATGSRLRRMIHSKCGIMKTR
jgi:hypothetical protein